MRPYVWKEDMTEKEMRDGAYFERNLLALAYAERVNRLFGAYMQVQGINDYQLPCGWYIHGEWKGWSRVVSLENGKITFHVPDDFDLGNLQQIEPNWDGHTTEEKWGYVMKICGMEADND